MSTTAPALALTERAERIVATKGVVIAQAAANIARETAGFDRRDGDHAAADRGEAHAAALEAAIARKASADAARMTKRWDR